MPIEIFNRMLNGILKRNTHNSTEVGKYKGPGNPKFPDFKSGINMIEHPPISQSNEHLFPLPSGKKDSEVLLKDMQKQAEKDGDWTSSGLLQLELEKIARAKPPLPAPAPTPLPDLPKNEKTLKEKFLSIFKPKSSKDNKLKEKEDEEIELEEKHFEELVLGGEYTKRYEGLIKDGYTEKAAYLEKPDIIKKKEEEEKIEEEKKAREEARIRIALTQVRERREAAEKHKKEILDKHGKYSWEFLTLGKSKEELKEIEIKAKKAKLSPKRYLLEERLKESVADELVGIGLTNLK